MNVTMRVLLAGALALFLAACSSSDSGIKRDRDQAILDRDAALSATAAAEMATAAAEMATTVAQDALEIAQARVTELESQVSPSIADLEAAVTAAMAVEAMATTDKGTADVALEAALADLQTALDGVPGSEDIDAALEAVRTTRAAAVTAQGGVDAAAAALAAAQSAMADAQAALAAADPSRAAKEAAQADLDTAKAHLAIAQAALKTLQDADAGRTEKAEAKAHSDMSKLIAKAVQNAGTTDDPGVVTHSKISDGAVKLTDFAAKEDGVLPEIAGWASHLQENTAAIDTTQIVALYTDVEPAKMKAFVEQYDSARDTNELGTFNVGDTDDDELAWAKARTDAGKKIVAAVATNTDPTDTYFTGTYDGAAGEFQFVNNAGWTFKLTSKSATVPVKDAEFLYFGWWKSIPDDSKGNISFTGIYGGSGPAFTSAAAGALTGQATFRGSAAGIYGSEDIVAGTADYGKFTASAELRATFGVVNDDSTVGVDESEQNGLTGTISQFQNDAGESQSTWKVKLGRIPYDATDDDPALDNDRAEAGSSKFGSATGTSTWEAAFYGTRKTDSHPIGVAGSFEASADRAMAIAGAFAARNIKADE